MEYLQQIYERFFGLGGGEYKYTPASKIVVFGIVLLDRTAQMPDTSFFDDYKLKVNTKGELETVTLAKLTAEACQYVKYTTNPGGAALNTVRILKHLGTDATFFGAVGDDKHALELKETFENLGIQTRLQTISDTPTGLCLCLVHKDTVSHLANIGASAKFSLDYLKKIQQDETQCFLRPIERKQVLFVESFFIPERQHVCEYIVENYIHERRRLALNLGAKYIIEKHFKEVMNLAHNAYFIFGNEIEFQTLVEQMGCKTLERMANELMQGGEVPKIIIITHGSEGVQLITNVESESTPVVPITFQSFKPQRVEEVVDATGAGDAFAAGFLHAWLEKRSLSECVRLGITVAAQVVTQIGCNLPPA